MHIKPAKYVRKGRTIFMAEPDGSIAREGKERTPVIHKTYPTIAEAKRASRQIQMDEDKGLGRGTVRVIST